MMDFVVTGANGLKRCTGIGANMTEFPIKQLEFLLSVSLQRKISS